jgi:hypothetical protein
MGGLVATMLLKAGRRSVGGEALCVDIQLGDAMITCVYTSVSDAYTRPDQL